jgi:signal transduction histidine kinase
VTLGDSELVLGLGLLLALACAGLGILALRWHEARRQYAATVELSDGAVLIVDDGQVIESSAAAETLLGTVAGLPVRAVLQRFLGPGCDAALTALNGLERSGEAIHLLAADAGGRPFELAGAPRGGQIRLVLRQAELLSAELERARAAIAARRDEVAQREAETRTLAGLLAGAPMLAWNRTADGRTVWAAGTIPTQQGVVEAHEAAAIAAARATRPSGQQDQAVDGDSAGRPARFRLEVAQPGDAEPIALDVIETTTPGGERLGLAVDASNALAAERTLARFVRTMTETFAHLNVGLAIFDPNQRLVMFNPALVEMWQADPGWMAQRPSLREILDSLRSNRRIPEMADFHGWRRRLTQLFQQTETADYEELWHLADGSDIRVRARPHPHRSLAFVFDDVTERMRLEQQYRHSLDLRRATLDRLDEGLAVFGPDGLLQLVNEAFHEIWGTDAEMIHSSMHANELIPLVRGLTVETGVWERLISYITGSGARQAWAARLTLGTGRIIGAHFSSLPDGSTMAAFSDVTDSERIAHALRERNDALEAAEEMRSAVLDRISYRLRTPLNTIYGFAQLIADTRFGALNEEQCNYASEILEAARQLRAAVDDVTDLASLELDAPQDEGAAPSLRETLVLTAQLLEKRATEEGVTLRIAAAQSDGEPRCDVGRLRQIVFGQTTDAISRCRDGGQVILGTQEGPNGGAEIYTDERRGEGAPFDPAAIYGSSLTLPFLRRLVAREGGVFTLELEADGTRVSSVCRFRPAAPADAAGAEDGG